MGDWVDTDVKWEETKPLISTTTTQEGTSRKHSHHRSVSYGSFLPVFTVDVTKLRRLLPQATEQTTPPRSGHCRIDSLLDNTPILDGTDSAENFLTVLNSQIDGLYSFTEFHLSQAQKEMEDFELQQLNSTVATPNTSSLINADTGDIEELDNTSIAGDSGIEDDHLSSTNGFLSRIKDILQNVKLSIDNSMKELDELVGIYDSRSQGNDDALSLLQSHEARRVSLNSKLNNFISKIDTKLNQYVDEDGSSDKILEMKGLQRAKKECFKFLDILGFIVLILSAAALTYLSCSLPDSRWTILLRLSRSPLMVAAYLYLLGFNMMVWARSGINYISIFDFPRNSIPTPRYMFQIGSLFSVLFGIMIVVCLVTGNEALYVSDKVTGLLMWVAILVFWLNPLKIFNRLGRFSFLLVFVRVLMAPFPVVMFADFWFADQLNSLLAFLLDIQYLFCYTFSPSSWNKDTLGLKSCTMVSNGVRPIILCLPALWRLLQCLRCYQKTRKVAHLFNAAKYFTTFPVVVFATFFAVSTNPSLKLSNLDLDKTGWMILGWMISSIVHALYCFYWDIVMDWGLFRVCNGYVLRPTLLYHRWTYVIAIFIDFVIRFACVIKLTLAIVYHIDSDVIYTSLILSEILRRVLWNFFRIEYEQILRSSS